MRLRSLLVLAALAGALFSLSACDSVGVEPQSEASASNVFTEDGSYESFLAKLYGAFNVTGQAGGGGGDADIEGLDEGFSQYMRLYWELQELPGDGAVIAWNDDGIRELNNQSWSSSNQFISAMYYRIYFAISQSNEFLRQSAPARLDEYGVTESRRDRIPQYRAEARFVRALAYYHGIDFFGNIPIVTEAFGLGVEAPQQNTREEVFDFIESELLAITEGGEGVLPEIGEGQYGRADKGAAYTLLAKLYLNAPVYTGADRSSEVVEYTGRILDAGTYTLEEEYHDLFLADNNTAEGIIFALPQDGEFTRHYGGTTFLVHAPYGGSMNPSVFGIDGGWFGMRTTSTYVDYYEEDDTRPVFPNVEPEGAQFYQEGQSKIISDIGTFTDGYAVPKFQNITSEGLPGSNATFPDTDFPLFRLADVYLMYAEGVVRGGGGDLSRAVDLVNAVRNRAFSDGGDDNDGSVSADELTLDFLLQERGRELMWEAQRRTDLIRFGQFSADGIWAWKGGVPEGQTTAAYRDLYPIPASELRANPNLEQNAGY